MVYTGKPSRACATCKKRRIKCDEGRPACGQCIKSKRECTGYKSEAELMFRDETKATARRAERARKSKSQSPFEDSQEAEGEDDYELVKVIDTDNGKTLVPNAQPDEDIYGIHGQNPVVDDNNETALVNFSRPATINKALMPPWIDIAKAYFFNDFIMPRQSHGFNHLQVVEHFYKACPEDDAIARTAEAVALLSLSRRPEKRFLRSEAANAYGHAVQTVAKAVADPVKLRKDSTLMSIMLLSFAETLDISVGNKPKLRPKFVEMPGEKSIARFHQAWGAHAYGAQLIVRIRGIEEMSSSMLSLPLLINSRFHAIIRNIFSCEPIDDPHQLYQPEVEQKSLNPNFTLLFGPQLEMAGIALHLPEKRHRSLNLLRQPMQPGLAAKLQTLLEDIRQLDMELVNWAYRTRVTRPERVAGYYLGNPLLDPADEKALPGHVFTYENIMTMNLWNHYRVFRMYSQMMIFNILERLVHPDLLQQDPEFVACMNEVISIAKDVAASLPYSMGYLQTIPLSPTPHPTHLGSFTAPEHLLYRFSTNYVATVEAMNMHDRSTRETQNSPSSFDTGSDSSNSTSEHSSANYSGPYNGDFQFTEGRSHVSDEHGPALSAWYMIWPLQVAQGMLPVSAWDKRWIRGRFRFIAEVFGVAQAYVYMGRARRVYEPNVARQTVTPFDFAPLPWEPLQ